MVQDQRAKAREPAGASDEAAAVDEWAAAVSVGVENAYARIVVIEQLTKEARPVTRLIVPNAGH
jgi:hypothetical protein